MWQSSRVLDETNPYLDGLATSQPAFLLKANSRLDNISIVTKVIYTIITVFDSLKESGPDGYYIYGSKELCSMGSFLFNVWSFHLRPLFL